MHGTVCVVGSLNLDLVTRVRRHPRPGETVAGQALRTLPGGKGANQALAAARAGARSLLVGRIGDDRDGASYLAGLAGHGVGCGSVVPTPKTRTGHAIVVVDDQAENSIVVCSGANAFVTPDDIDAASDAVVGADVLLLQLELPGPTVLHAARLAASAGVRVVLNASPWTALPQQLIALADLVVVNEHEAVALGGLASSVCMTLGSRGARWGETHAPAPQVDAVDTTGAGDAFAGTLAAHLAVGASPDESLRAAVAAGAATCGHSGAQGWAFAH